jgi:hypothetical protein
MMNNSQLPQGIMDIIQSKVDQFHQTNSVETVSRIPDTTNIPLKDNKWLKIEDVICVYADMIASTKLSANDKYGARTASAYELFTGTIIRIFHYFDAAYIDVKGDGVFALFNSNQVYHSLVAAVTVKTFAEETFVLNTIKNIKWNTSRIKNIIAVIRKTNWAGKPGSKLHLIGN